MSKEADSPSTTIPQLHHSSTGLTKQKLSDHDLEVLQRGSTMRSPLQEWQQSNDDVPVGQKFASKRELPVRIEKHAAKVNGSGGAK